ncbi:aminotransferase class V-fold PLP-dependent enzyme [soil metagenome]
MAADRRSFIKTAGSLPLLASSLASARAAMPEPATRTGPVALPDKAGFTVDGIHLNAAYCHPIGVAAQQANAAYVRSRMVDGGINWPRANPRNEAATLFARLINADPKEIAVVPSTLEGENLVAASLGLGPGAGVVTDPFHYDASLALYGEMQKRGMPLTVIAPRANRIHLEDIAAAIKPDTRLIAISLVSSDTGFLHDLKTICDIAHAKGALVYADIIQAAGAIAIDVRASGVDFCCAGQYKWLMGEFGAAYLYVRADRLPDLKRVQLGWRGVRDFTKHFRAFDPPGPTIGTWDLASGTAAALFEVSTPSWSALATSVGALAYINAIGVDAIAAHRKPLLNRLREEMPKLGFATVTPADAQGPSIVFAYEGARARFAAALEQAKIYVTVWPNGIRISPSVHNDMADIDALRRVLRAMA